MGVGVGGGRSFLVREHSEQVPRPIEQDDHMPDPKVLAGGLQPGHTETTLPLCLPLPGILPPLHHLQLQGTSSGDWLHGGMHEAVVLERKQGGGVQADEGEDEM